MANPLFSDNSPEYQAKLAVAADALNALDPHKRMGSRLFAAFNRMGCTSSVIFPPLRIDPETGKQQVLLQLRPDTEVWPSCWGLPASALNADESKEEALTRIVRALGCELKIAVPLYGAEWYMTTAFNPFVDPIGNERGSYYHYPYYVEVSGEPTVGVRGWQWWNVDGLPDRRNWVVHHIEGALFPALKYLQNRAQYDAALEQIREALGLK